MILNNIENLKHGGCFAIISSTLLLAGCPSVDNMNSDNPSTSNIQHSNLNQANPNQANKNHALAEQQQLRQRYQTQHRQEKQQSQQQDYVKAMSQQETGQATAKQVADPWTQYYQAKSVLEQSNTNPNEVKSAVQSIHFAAHHDVKAAQLWLADAYQNASHGIEKNQSKSLYWQQIAQQNNS